MATQPTTSTQPPNLSSFLKAAHEWLGEDYSSIVVKHVLDSRDQLASEIKRALDAPSGTAVCGSPGASFSTRMWKTLLRTICNRPCSAECSPPTT